MVARSGANVMRRGFGARMPARRMTGRWMIAAELRVGGKPSLEEALGWIGSRVDDIYGAGVGSLEDVWIDPGTGAPRWLLVREGHFGDRTTLIPFEDATAGAGHVWVPYERGVVGAAPVVEPGTPLTHQLEASLRTHYAAYAPASISHGGPAPDNGGGPEARTEAVRCRRSPEARYEGPNVPAAGAYGPRPRAPQRSAPAAAQPTPRQQGPQGQPYAPPARPPGRPPPAATAPEPPLQPPAAGWVGQPGQPLAAPDQREGWGGPQAAGPQPVDQLRVLAESGGSHYVEIELSGELLIRGELRSIRVIPR